jgi:hypothetical protein
MKDTKDIAREELSFCLDLWAKRGSCSFGGGTTCDACGAPYLLYKLSTGQVLHGEMDRLSHEDWVKIEQQLSENS